MKEGKYDNTHRHPMMGGTTKKPHEWSFGRVQYPYYCTHVFFMNKLSEKYDVPLRTEYGRQYDDDGNPVSAQDDAVVTIEDVPSAIELIKIE